MSIWMAYCGQLVIQMNIWMTCCPQQGFTISLQKLHDNKQKRGIWILTISYTIPPSLNVVLTVTWVQNPIRFLDGVFIEKVVF